MTCKRVLSFILSLIMLISALPPTTAAQPLTEAQKGQRSVWLHAQGESPTETTNVSTVYMGDTVDLFFAIDNPNKGEYNDAGTTDEEKHPEPQYDLNGYTVKIYFDPAYFTYAASNTAKPIDFTVPDRRYESSSGIEIGEEVPTQIGYFQRAHGSDTKVINGKTYNAAYAIIFFSGNFLPQKEDGQLWYNLCSLPLTPIKTGNTEVFIDVDGTDEYTLELFAKNATTGDYPPAFDYTAVNGGYHTIVIKDKLKPSAPVADPITGTYTETQYVTLKAEEDCKIYYSTDGGKNYTEYIDGDKIEVSRTSNIITYAERISDGKLSNAVTYSYRIIPKAPHLFVDKAGEKELIPNIYSEGSPFVVYATDKNVFGNIEDYNQIYYTFGNADAEDPVFGDDRYSEWVAVDKTSKAISITENTTVRLFTKNILSDEISDVAWYHLGITPQPVESSHPSGEYDKKIDVTLSTDTKGANIYYTTDGSDPISGGLLYTMPIALAKDTTLRAVAEYNGKYSTISSFYYIFTFYDDYGVDAFYPSGVYEGSVNVTLTPNNPDNTVFFRTADSNAWEKYTTVLLIESDTEIIAKSVDKNGNEGGEYKFTYVIKPLPPAFAPESTQFTNAESITIYCPESTKDNTERFTLYYTTDGSDPITSPTAIPADGKSDSAIIHIDGYTVVSAVVKKDNSTYSSVVTHSYDIVTLKPVKPLMTLLPGNYTHEIDNEDGFITQFMPVPTGTEIYYTISDDGSFVADPLPEDTANTIKYDGNPITVKGNTIIKAVAVNLFGVKSDIGIFEYTITPEAPKAAPSATVSGTQLPLVPVAAVKGSTVRYDINGFVNEFLCTDGEFYLDTHTGNAYDNADKTGLLGSESTSENGNSAALTITSELDLIESEPNKYIYNLSNRPEVIAPPYADKDTGTYEEINIDGNNNFLLVGLYSLNENDEIQYTTDNGRSWNTYTGTPLPLSGDTILQLRAKKGDDFSGVVSYVYNFVPLAPIITLPSGRYSQTPTPTTKLALDSRAPSNQDYAIFYRSNGDKEDFRYRDQEKEILSTMSFKAYVKNMKTQKVSANTIHYYIIETETTANGNVYVASPYNNVSRISTSMLSNAPYSEGIKLLTQNKNAQIHYYYVYTKSDNTTATTNIMVYDIEDPIFVNSSMKDITIYAWLEDSNGHIYESDMVPHHIEFVSLKVPKPSLEATGKVEFNKGTKYTIENDHADDPLVFIYYTLDGKDPIASGKLYNGETLTVNGAVTVKTVYYSACGTCLHCKNDDYQECINSVWGDVGTYKYTVPTVNTVHTGGTSTVIDKTRKYTKDIFGTEHPTHIGYIYGYSDGSVRPEGHITREEIAAILYRIKNKTYEVPVTVTGDIFPDVKEDRWSVAEIEYLAYYDIIRGYPDGSFGPTSDLTRAEFAALLSRFIDHDGYVLTTSRKLPSEMLAEIGNHWAYEDIVKIYNAGLIEGYEDKTFRPDNPITRAEVMTVINRILGRKPMESYVKSLDFNPFNDLEESKWYYVTVLEATITHNYYLDNGGYEYIWEDCK